jgi:hypothetical protein
MAESRMVRVSTAGLPAPVNRIGLGGNAAASAGEHDGSNAHAFERIGCGQERREIDARLLGVLVLL